MVKVCGSEFTAMVRRDCFAEASQSRDDEPYRVLELPFCEGYLYNPKGLKCLKSEEKPSWRKPLI